MDWLLLVLLPLACLFLLVSIIVTTSYVPSRKSRLGRHYRQHMHEFYVKFPTFHALPDMPRPLEICWRCKVSYQFQRLRWWLNGDIIV